MFIVLFLQFHICAYSRLIPFSVNSYEYDSKNETNKCAKVSSHMLGHCVSVGMDWMTYVSYIVKALMTRGL